MIRSQTSLFRYALLTAVATFFLLIAGSLVTSTDSGLAVPDWPLSYGTLFPPMVGGIRFEHGHRMIAGLVGIMILILAIWAARVESRRWVRRLALSAAAAVFLQALLGGLTVLLLLPPQISIAHACLGQTVFCLVVSLTYGLSSRWSANVGTTRHDLSRLRITAWLLAVLAATQLLFGAVIRHTGLWMGMVAHLINGSLLILVTAIFTRSLMRCREDGQPLQAHMWRLWGLLVLQVLFGFLVLLHRRTILFRTVHVALGALVLAQTVIMVWELFHRSLPALRTQPSSRVLEVPQ